MIQIFSYLLPHQLNFMLVLENRIFNNGKETHYLLIKVLKMIRKIKLGYFVKMVFCNFHQIESSLG